MTSSSSCEHLIRALELNCSSASYINSVSVLLRILDNIINEPHINKYRTIRLENQIIKEKLLPLHGIRELLSGIGFIEVNGTLSLPAAVPIASVRRIRDQLQERLDFIEHKKPGQTSSTSHAQPSGSKSTKNYPTSIIPFQSFPARTTFQRVVPFANAFLQHIEDRSDQVLQYEDDRLQLHGRKVVPVQQLSENALHQMRSVQKQQQTDLQNENDPSFDDWFLVELTKWFHESFFEWVNTMPCKVCHGESKGRKVSSIENGLRVEILHCCNTETKFHRYNDISQLLLTRKGRCGEYANCFTFLCRSLGYEARLVYATFDHVWTEVFSEAQNRWLHIDPSDNVIDAPLMYQHGWKRKIDYIIAYSNEDVQDVTWRYTNNHQEIRINRTNCSERELLRTILLLREKRQKNTSVARRRFVARRNLREVIQSMVERPPTDNELNGRSSGSLSWRMSRGEKGSCTADNFSVFNAFEVEAAHKQFNLRYSTVTNTYERYLIGENKQIEVHDISKDWQSCIYRCENIFRKEERDWKMAYLARIEDTNTAQIQWNFDFSATSLKIKDVQLVFNTMTYENGLVELEILHKGEKLPSIDSVKNLESFSLCAKLSGGKDSCAWQHTQLFRQSMSASNEYPFNLQITFY